MLLVWQVSTYFMLVWILENLIQFLQSQSAFKQIEETFIRVLLNKTKITLPWFKQLIIGMLLRFSIQLLGGGPLQVCWGDWKGLNWVVLYNLFCCSRYLFQGIWWLKGSFFLQDNQKIFEGKHGWLLRNTPSSLELN